MKLRIMQPLIPSYREPFFATLAANPDLDVEVWADLNRSGNWHPAPDSSAYRRIDAPYREIGPAVWQPALMEAVDGGAEVVVAPWNARYAHLVPAIRKAHRRGVGVVLWGHGVSKEESTWRRAIRDYCGRAADALVLYTPSIGERLRSADRDPGRIFVAPNSIDRDPIDQARRRWPEDRLAEFLSQRQCRSRRVVVFLSRLQPEKRVDVLIEAFRLALPEHPDLRLVLIGDGPARLGLEQQALRAGIESHVMFEGAVFDEDRIAPWMTAALCMAYPGPIGLSLLHAFAYGLPVVTAGERGAHGPEIEAFVDDVNGLRVPADDANALAAAIEALAADTEFRDRLARNAARSATGEHAWSMAAMIRGFTDAVEFARRR